MKILYIGCPVRIVSSDHGWIPSGERIADDDPHNPTGKTGTIVGRNDRPIKATWKVRMHDHGTGFFYAESWELEPIVPEGLMSEVMAEEKEDESVPEKVP